jgi:peptidoglycan/LPS O-acetylase OafA/YrhL
MADHVIDSGPSPIAAKSIAESGPVSLNVGETTSTGKQHFDVLDGLRGSAALSVVLFHIQAIAVGWRPEQDILPHAYLAVDFFFLLSGFVIGYAYDDRWKRMSIGGFFLSRLIRLHPLAVLGTLLGLASYLFDPFAAGAQHSRGSALAITLALGLLLLPSPPRLAGRWSDTHPLNGPAWTLLQEYIANIVYALALRHQSTRVIGILAFVAGIVLAACATGQGTLDLGSDWQSLWIAPVRLAFPFLTGLLIYRLRPRLPRIEIGYLPLTLVLAAVFLTPALPVDGVLKANGIFAAFCVIVVFPLVVIAGAHSNAGRGMARLCRVSGRISYPLYITHFPFVYIWSNYLTVAHPPTGTAIGVGIALAFFILAFAWAAHRLWDIPIREWLSARRGTTKSTPA